MVSTRQIRTLLRFTMVLFGAATASVVWWAWSSDVGKLPRDTSESRPSPPTQNVAEGSSLSISAFGRLWDKPLRSPLYDPPKPSQPAEIAKPAPKFPRRAEPRPVPPPSLDIRLVGTILESGRSMAILADATGKIDLKGAGQMLDLDPEGICVESIAAESVTVSHGGRQEILRITKSATAGKSKPKQRNRR